MMTLYKGTRNKLSYIATKMTNMAHAFYHDNEINKRFTPNANAVEKMEREIKVIEDIANCGEVYTPGEWKMVEKYITLADEFRAAKGIPA
jgi:hypothetical protein